MSQEEMDQCWKKLAEKMEEEVLDKYKVQQKRCFQRQRLLFGMEACTRRQEVQDAKVVRRLLGKIFRFVQRVQPAASAKHA